MTSEDSRTAGPVKAVLYGVLVVYGLVALGSAGSSLAPLDKLRTNLTRPVEKVFGIHQTWPMFRRAPRYTTWLELRGTPRQGKIRTLSYLPGEPDPDGVRWTYDRLGKLQRTAAAGRREKLRMGIVRWVCRTEKAAGRPLSKLQLVRHEARTPRPGTQQSRADFAVEVEGLKRWNCR